MVAVLVFFYCSILKLRRKNYFIKRNEERYAETINAAKDGYYIFIYPDEDIRQNAIEHCSRRLAVILDLSAGIDSDFKAVMHCFYKDDAEKITKYIALLREDGVSFEDKFNTKSNKTLNLSGARISGADGSIFGDIIWFRDISNDASYVDSLLENQNNLKKELVKLEDMVDNLPYPAWIRDADLNLAGVNKKYIEFIDCFDKTSVVADNKEIDDLSDEKPLRGLAGKAKAQNRVQRQNLHFNRNGKRLCFEATETPFHSEESLDKIATVGTLVEISELDELKRDIRQHQNAGLAVLGALGTAFAVFDGNFSLSFYNQAFKSLWKLDDAWFETPKTYGVFLDELRERRMLPELPDYTFFKNEEQKMFGTIIEAKEDLMHLPDGRSLRRVRAPYLNGGIVFAFEDISERLAASREHTALLNVQQEILNNINDAVLIFGSNGRLKFYNQAYLKLWNLQNSDLQLNPTFNDMLEMQRDFFANVRDWEALKKDIVSHLFSSDTQAFSLRRSSNDMVECISVLLSNESIMVAMHKITAFSQN